MVCVRACVRGCVCVCVCEREREREGGGFSYNSAFVCKNISTVTGRYVKLQHVYSIVVHLFYSCDVNRNR